MEAVLTSDLSARNSSASTYDLVTTRLARAIYCDWQERVTSLTAERPFSPFEISKLNSSDEAELEVNPITAYGATLLAAGIGSSSSVLARIGDGAIAMIDSGGEVVFPFQEETEPGTEATLSLCLSNAHRFIETHLIPHASHPPRCIVLATDGYTKSFRDRSELTEAIHALYYHIERHGVEDFRRGLRQLLEDCTNSGSGDDTTLSLLINTSVLD